MEVSPLIRVLAMREQRQPEHQGMLLGTVRMTRTHETYLAANVSSGILEPPSMKARKMAQKNLIQSHMISLLFHESVILHDLRRSSR